MKSINFFYFKENIKSPKTVPYKILSMFYKLWKFGYVPQGKFGKTVFGVLYFIMIITREFFYYLRRCYWAGPLLASRCKNMGVNVFVERLPFISGYGVLNIGDNVRLSGLQSFSFSNITGEKPTISIGNSTFIGHNVTLNAARSLTIGANNYIAGFTYISDNAGHPLDPVARRENKLISIKDIQQVTLGDNVWLGRNVTVLKGVTIGENAVVGAGSVVTKDVPANCVVAGNPARIIRYLNST